MEVKCANNKSNISLTNKELVLLEIIVKTGIEEYKKKSNNQERIKEMEKILKEIEIPEFVDKEF